MLEELLSGGSIRRVIGQHAPDQILALWEGGRANAGSDEKRMEDGGEARKGNLLPFRPVPPLADIPLPSLYTVGVRRKICSNASILHLGGDMRTKT